MPTKTHSDFKQLLEKYSVNIPRYTSYPTAPEWKEAFTKDDFLLANKFANDKCTPISLYFHLPFCESRCSFCGCNVVISKKNSIVKPYLEHIKKEIQSLSKNIGGKREVHQIHLGGGTPTYFQPDELKELFSVVKDSFNIAKSCEAGVEVDPRVTSIEHLKVLSELGFKRLSMGIQDFELSVQEAINRVQTFDETNTIFKAARELGFQSISVDLIYGLPYQSKSSFSRTVDLIIKLNPDRIALFHYAHLPQLLKHQAKYIREESLPDSEIKIEIFQEAVSQLSDNNYGFIGLDHFAKPTDELMQAKENGTLHRNFQGYTTKANCDLYGFGISAISSIQNIFSQNIKKLYPYYEKINFGEMPLFRGFVLNNNDLLRKEIIMRILCHGVVFKKEIEKKHDVTFNKYFSYELDKLIGLQNDNLIELTEDYIKVTTVGKFFLRNIACVFDYYLQRKDKGTIYSKSI